MGTDAGGKVSVLAGRGISGDRGDGGAMTELQMGEAERRGLARNGG